MIDAGSHDLIDRCAHSVAHRLHMFHESLFSIEWTLVNGGSCGVIVDATWAQHLAFWLNGRVSGRNDDSDSFSKAERVWHGCSQLRHTIEQCAINVMEFVCPLY